MHGCLPCQSICCQHQQVLRLAILKEIDEANLLVVYIFNLTPHQLKDMLTMVIPHETILVFISQNEPLFLKLIPIPEADKTTLRESHRLDLAKVMLQLECEMLTLELILFFREHLFVFSCSQLRLDQIAKSICLLHRGQCPIRCVHHELLRLQNLLSLDWTYSYRRYSC